MRGGSKPLIKRFQDQVRAHNRKWRTQFEGVNPERDYQVRVSKRERGVKVQAADRKWNTQIREANERRDFQIQTAERDRNGWIRAAELYRDARVEAIFDGRSHFYTEVN